MTDSPKIKGPASYFPPIEKTCGQPIAHWMGLLDGLRHGHANALVARHLAQGKPD